MRSLSLLSGGLSLVFMWHGMGLLLWSLDRLLNT
jgi:hypothetical protein